MTKNKDIVYERHNEKLIKLSVDKPIILEFGDGSRIEYHLTVEEKPINALNFTTSSSTKTYTVIKTYFYIIGLARVYLHADCTHDGRYVTMNRCYDTFWGSFAKLVSHGTAIIKSRGYQRTCAIGEGWGEIVFQITEIGEWAYQAYRLQIWVDPAGIAYLKEI